MSMDPPPLCIVLVGAHTPGTPPTAAALTDRVEPSSIRNFTVAELGAFRALMDETGRAIDALLNPEDDG